jgi:hypothetical protein
VHVDIEHALPFVHRILGKGDVGTGDAGRADQRVHAPECLCRLLRHALDRICIRNVERVGHGGVAEQCLGGSEGAGIAVPQSDARATFDEPSCDGESDACSTAGDGRRAAVEIKYVHRSSFG